MQMNRISYGLNANQLKAIAVAAMVIDHTAAYLLPASFPFSWEMRLIGRITAPIMCFFIAEGYAHTSNLRRYALRLLFFAAVSHIPFLLLHGGLSHFFETTGVIWTLLMGLLALSFGKEERLPLWVRMGLVLACCVLAFPADWGWIGVLWVFGFGMCRENKARAAAVFSVVGALYIIRGLSAPLSLFTVSRLGVFLSLPLLWLYNGKHGSRSRVLQASYYWFYPVHLLAIWGIRLLTL